MSGDYDELDPAKIPDGMNFLRPHLSGWGFLIDPEEAEAFRARATHAQREELRRIAARFKEPEIALAYEAWFEVEELCWERWWAERLLSTADNMGLYE